MPAAGVVEAVDVAEERDFDLAPGLPVATPDQFGFQGFEEAFDCRIIVTIALSAGNPPIFNGVHL